VIAFVNRASEVAAVAAQYADEVDRETRFPHETLRALKEARLLSILIPEELGGESAQLSDVAEIRSLIGQNCALSPEDDWFHLPPGQDKLIRLIPPRDATGAAPRGFVAPLFGAPIPYGNAG
jgi:alkylation response protein AidB-like acyl-CoA dehydrogenase